MPYELKKSVVLVGMMGSGKTAVGGALGRELQVPVLDSDAEIVEAANLTIAEIFERYGEPFFREKETQVLARLLKGPPAVLSAGGGAFLSEQNRALISHHGVSVWLRADLELLWQRVRHKTTRPLLHAPRPKARLAELQKERTPAYELADLVVDARAGYSIDDMAGRVLETLLTRPDVLEATK